MRDSFFRGAGSKSRFPGRGLLEAAARPRFALFEAGDGLAQCLGPHAGQGVKAGADQLALGGDKAVGEASALQFGQQLVVRLGEGKGVADGRGAAGRLGSGWG